MADLYIANKNYSSWSLRPWILMRMLDIPFDERLVPFGSTSFLSFSPTGKVPCLVDGASRVWDSMGIAEYLAERHAGVWPADGEARAWARCAAAEMHSGFVALRDVCSMNCGVRVRLATITPALQKDAARIGELWMEGLQRFGGPFLAGDRFTAVDAFFAPVAFRWQTYGFPLPPEAQAYAERLLGLAPMRDWYAAALAETWRDAEHEADIHRHGTVTQDLRATA